MAEITPEERVQKVKAHLLEDLEFEPEQVRNFYTSNIFGRAFAHLVGWTGKKARMLRCTAAGELKTAPTTTGIESYTVTDASATDGILKFFFSGAVVSRVDIFIWDNPALVMLSLDGTTYGAEIEVPAGFYSVECRALKFGIRNKTAGQTARYQIVGWW